MYSVSIGNFPKWAEVLSRQSWKSIQWGFGTSHYLIQINSNNFVLLLFKIIRVDGNKPHAIITRPRD